MNCIKVKGSLGQFFFLLKWCFYFYSSNQQNGGVQNFFETNITEMRAN